MPHHHHDAHVEHDGELPDDYSTDGSVRGPKWFKVMSMKASNTHSRVPGLKKLPFPAVAIIALLIFVNIIVWVAAGIILVSVATYKQSLYS